ncbi:flavin reductase family protein [Microbacterium sp. 67-17]|uniref:flavin reductase family protein n=1 Tax=Microbacterium sp. 67-17 TaxID=1895782 RepID=UPI000AE3B950|nr:flavin reductase family protein [Microbacterium sp. 67-17]
MTLKRELPDPQLLRQTFALFPSGVACIGAVVDGANEALVASSFTVGVSLDPPLVSFAVQNGSQTWPIVRRAASIGISVMASDHEPYARKIASKDRAHRFDGVDTHVAESGALFLMGSPVWLECSIYSEFPAGDHHMVLLQVDGLGLNPELNPLVFHRSGFRSMQED